MKVKVNIQKGDIVSVITGAYKGDRGDRKRVLRVLPERRKLIVENVSVIHKHLKRSQQNPQGGRITKEAPIDISNVMLVCPQCDEKTRVGRTRGEDGSTRRVCKKCGEQIEKK